jgi:hypothetical protein
MTDHDAHDHDSQDQRLRKALGPPPDVTVIAQRALEHARVGNRTRVLPALPAVLARLATAAALLITALGLLWWAGSTSDHVAVPGRGASIEPIYAELVDTMAASFPACSSESQLASVFDERYGQELYLRIDITRPVAGPFDCTSWPSATLMGSPLPEPVALLVDTLEADPHLVSDAEAGLHAHRRELGRLVIYELSRNAEPVCLDLFFTPGD